MVLADVLLKPFITDQVISVAGPIDKELVS